VVQSPATNGYAGDFNTPIPNAYYLVAPANTTIVRYQVTMHVVAGAGEFSTTPMSLLKKIPVTLTASRSGANINISWTSQGATSYQVVYKDNLTDANWDASARPIAGDGGLKSVSYATSGSNVSIVC